MTKREMNIRIFAGKQIPHPLFQPRIEPWFVIHKERGDLPPQCQDKTLLELYDDLDLSMRYISYYTGMPHPVQTQYSDEVKIREKTQNGTKLVVIDTPYGELVQQLKLTSDQAWRTVEFAAKQREDLKKLAWLYHHTVFSFSAETFQQGSDFIGDRGAPQFWVPKSPYRALSHIWMTLTDFVYALNDVPGDVVEVMKAIDSSYDSLYEQLVAYASQDNHSPQDSEETEQCHGLKIINFGENIDAHLLNPQYLEEYLIPFYEKRSNQLRRAGIYTHIHIDGSFRPILDYLADLPFDGLEALTPLPQGDVSIEEMKQHIGDKILLDGIPAVLFLRYYPRAELQESVEKLLNSFHPRLVLGISDELPQGGDEESLSRVKWVADYCRQW